MHNQTMRRLAALLWLSIISAYANAADSPAYAAAPGSSAAGSLFQVFLGLIAVLILIAGSAWVAKRFGVTRGGASSILQVISSASVGARERVVVVEVGESWLVVGVAPGSVSALLTLPKGERTATGNSLAANSSFAARFQQMIEKRNGR